MIKKNVVGGFVNALYWTSTEYQLNPNSNLYAYYQDFGTGIQNYEYKNNTYRVRAIRQF